MTGIILAGVDNSQTALRAAEKAASLAVAFEAELHVVTAFNVNTTETLQSVRSQSEPAVMRSAYHRVVAQYAGEAKRTASGVAEKLLRVHPELKIVAKAVEGRPGAALISEAKKLDVDLVVVGNKRVQGPTRVLGSVARTVASEASCDLYIVNTHHH